MGAGVKEMTPHKLQLVGAVADGNQYSDSSAILVGVDDVLVSDRYRKDLGDVSDLKKSIVEVGLLNPITVREWHGGYRLVAGERRLTAFRELGLAEIPARIARDIADARDALVAERDENTARKEMLPSEKVALGMAIEEMERPAAMERMLAGTPRVPGPEGKQDMRPRDIAAEAIDMGEATYRRIKTLITIADDDAQHEEVREASRVGIEVIDAGGAARGQYDRVKEVQRKTESVTTEVTSEPADPPAKRVSDLSALHHSLAKKYPTPRIAFAAEGHERYASAESFRVAASAAGAKYQFTEKGYAKHATQSQEWLERSSMNIEVALDVLGHIDFETITPEQAEEALQRLNVTRQLNLYIRTLKGITNE